jgi:eukaryotic-like serine/threonine-protein kinase
MRFVAGTMITAKVRLVRPIGRGGMGRIWLAEHLALGTEVAVKVVASSRPGANRRFLREVGIAARLRSPHVPRIFDHGQSGDQPFMVMELLHGETLGARLAREGGLPTEHVRLIVSQVASVLEEAHERGIAHRDIKPENVFLVASDYDVFVKVLDFGIAKPRAPDGIAETTSTGAVVGTPHYMSPEQLLAHDGVDHRTDLWSLGVLAYEALTGERPFVGPSMAALSLAICHADFRPATALRPELPAAIDAWFARALSVPPEDRFPSAKDQSRAFVAALEGDSTWLPLGTQGGKPGELPPPELDVTIQATTARTRAPRRHRTVAIAAGTLLVSLVATAAWRTEHVAAARGPATASATAAPPPAPVASDGPTAETWAASERVLPDHVEQSPQAAPTPSSPPAAATHSNRASSADRGGEATSMKSSRPPIPTSKPRATPCDGEAAFVRDADGHLVLRNECLPSR